VILAKQRNGPTGTVHLVWEGNTTRFRNQSYTAPPEGAHRSFAAPTRPRAAAQPSRDLDDLPM
jgi:hypothetical protein